MGLIRTNLFAVVTSYPFYVEADDMEEALEIARNHTSEHIREIRAVRITHDFIEFIVRIAGIFFF